MFPDRHHIDKVRQALWHQPKAEASVMVGSGFSRNAQAINPEVKPLPLLEEIAAELAKILYSQDGLEIEGRAVAGNLLDDDVSRLAEEYRSDFGPDELHDTLCSLVRDTAFVPGDAHKRLLRLPWADVFTTNWDTLLERAITDCSESAYTVVRTASDIPGKSRPRIVKLHGSIPDSPLIITSEDYRRYRSDFAPLEHTVRQAMMETVFLLLGFSGNDPNFHEWSGWVRDHLAESSPRIYVAGYLNLPGPTRRRLTKQKIIPIDLARHPTAKEWPKHRRHELATEWVLAKLESPPADAQMQSTPRDRPDRVNVSSRPAPVVADALPVPVDEPLGPPSRVSSKDYLNVVQDTLAVWAHNRKCYPEWLVPPAHVWGDRRVSTERWTPLILEVLPSLSQLNRLAAFREIIWRYERSLTQVPDELRAAARDTLKSIDCASETVEGNAKVTDDWNRTLRMWRQVALSLLTAARYRFETLEFNELLLALDPLVTEDLESGHGVRHERCLRALWDLDYESLNKCLDEWTTEEGDPAWKIRKSALLRELGRENEAAELIERVLEEARGMPVDERDLRGPSLEGWALWSVATFSQLENVRQRWSELGAVNCDPSMEIEWLAKALRANRRNAAIPRFELGARSKEPHDSSRSAVEAAAYRSIRLTEVAGLPLAVDSMSIAGHLLKLASERLAARDLGLAIRVLLRVVRYDKDETLMRVLSRERVAALPTAQAECLADMCRDARDYAMACIIHAERRPNLFWVESARVSMEALSRLVLRLDPVAVESILDEALTLYNNPRFASAPLLHEPLRNTLSRCWDSLSDAQKEKWALDLLDAPIVGLDGPDSEWSWYPDPGQIVSENFGLPGRSAASEELWRAIVERIIRGLSTPGMARQRAAGRLPSLALSGVLTANESERVASALWNVAADESDELPRDTPIFDYGFVLLPEPKPGVARERFGRKWLSGDVGQVSLAGLASPGGIVGWSGGHANPRRADDILWQVGLSIPFLRKHGSALQLTAMETEYLTAVIEKWSGARLGLLCNIPDVIRNEHMWSLRGGCHGLSWILTEMEISNGLGARLYDKVHELNGIGVLAYSMLPGIANTLRDRIDEIALLMSAGLVSDNRETAQKVVVTLHSWMIWAAEVGFEMVPMPARLVRDIGISIAARRQAVLAQALDCAKWVLQEGSEEQREIIRELTIGGLGDLSDELRYEGKDVWEGDLDVPLVRWRCIQVARVLAQRGWVGEPAVRRWLEIGRDDPLPEVRHVAERWDRETGMLEHGTRTGKDSPEASESEVS